MTLVSFPEGRELTADGRDWSRRVELRVHRGRYTWNGSEYVKRASVDLGK